MTKKQSQSFLKRLSAIAGAVGLGTLAVSPALAQTNPNPSIFSEPPYNRAGNNAGTMMPGDPASEAAPAAEMDPSYSEPAATPETMPAEDSMMEAPDESMTDDSMMEAPADSMEAPEDSMEAPDDSMMQNSIMETPAGSMGAPEDSMETPDDSMEAPAEPMTEEDMAPPTSSDAPAEPTAEATIVDVAASAGSFQILTAALQATGLVDTLSQEGPFTVFAPTDEAFAALPEGTLEELMKPENRETLAAILTYHVVPGKVTSDQIQSGEVSTVQGSSVDVAVEDGMVMVNDAKVVQPDIEAGNGVIHVIDKVILPQS